MASREQVDVILEKLEMLYPVDFLKQVNELQIGIGAVLQFLHKSQGTVTAGQISEKLGVSTARIAVLLRKMDKKGLLSKEKGIVDGRVTIVKITDLGEQIASDMQNEMRKQVESIIDAIGEERVLEFFDICNDIQSIVKASGFNS